MIKTWKYNGFKGGAGSSAGEWHFGNPETIDALNYIYLSLLIKEE